MASPESERKGLAMSAHVITVVDATIDPARETDLLAGFRALNEGERPPGLLCSQLLRGQDGAWRIESTWDDLESLMALRRAGRPPAALALLEGLGAEHSHAWFTVEQSYED